MLYLSLPASTKVGDVVDVKINGKPQRVTWHGNTLTIEPDDVRTVHEVLRTEDTLCFICGSAMDEPQHGVTMIRPDAEGNVHATQYPARGADEP